jgi:predicted CoA-binding protein
MGRKNQQPVGLKKDWARLYTDKSPESTKAAELLRDAGYFVVTFPVNGNMGPELILGRQVYRGLREIKEATKK